MLHAGQRLGRYELRRRLGAGSFAEVWRATERGELGFSTEVAVKILHPERSDEAELQALLKEAALCAALDHPNIVEVRRVQREGERVLVAMELVEGGSLAELLARTAALGLALPASVALDIGIDLARGLEHAWSGERPGGGSFGVVHRDLKPANVLLGTAGEAKIADFGIAKARGDVAATATGTLKGTPCYVAPETWTGGRDFRPPVDLFALGCILFELLTGRRLFDADSIVGVVSQVTSGVPADEVAPIRARCAPLAPVLEALLERDPARRTQRAAELLRQLQAVRAELAVAGDVRTFLIALRALEGGPGGPPSSLPPTSDEDWAALAARLAERSGEPVAVPALPPTIEAPTPGEPSRPEEVGPTRLVPTGRRRGVASAVLWPALALGVAVVVALALVVVGRGPDRVADAASEAAETVEETPRSTPAMPASRPSPATSDPAGGRPEAPAVPQPGARTRAEARREAPPDVSPAPPPEVFLSSPSLAELTPEPVEVEPEAVAQEVMRADAPPDEQDACLVLVSHPIGARVWIDGARSGRPAGGAARRGTRLPPGTIEVSMGRGGEPTVREVVGLEAGVATIVRCDLSVRGACSVLTGDFAPCR